MSYLTSHRPRLVLALAASCAVSIFTISSIATTGSATYNTSRILALPIANIAFTSYYIRRLAIRYYTTTNAADLDSWPLTPLFSCKRSRRRYLHLTIMMFILCLITLEIWNMDFVDMLYARGGSGDERVHYRKIQCLQFLASTLVLFQGLDVINHEDHWQISHSLPNGLAQYKDKEAAPLGFSPQHDPTRPNNDPKTRVDPTEVTRAILTTSLILSTLLFAYHYILNRGFNVFPPLLAILHHTFYLSRPAITCPSRECRDYFMGTGDRVVFWYFIPMGSITTLFFNACFSGLLASSHMDSNEWPVSVLAMLETFVVGAGFLHSLRTLPYRYHGSHSAEYLRSEDPNAKMGGDQLTSSEGWYEGA